VELVGGFAGLVGFFGVHGLGAGDAEELGSRDEVGLGVDELLADGEDADHGAVGLVDSWRFEEGGEFVEVEARHIAEVEDGVALVGEKREEFVDDLEFEVWRVAIDEGAGEDSGEGEAGRWLGSGHGPTITGGVWNAIGVLRMSRFWRTRVVDRGINHSGHREHRGLRGKDLGWGEGFEEGFRWMSRFVRTGVEVWRARLEVGPTGRGLAGSRGGVRATKLGRWVPLWERVVQGVER
jgi:hypothetical protein